MIPVIEINNISKIFVQKFRDGFKKKIKCHVALRDVNFQVFPGEVVGIVGESGSGKTTLGKIVVHLLTPTTGSVYVKGTEITRLTQRQFRPLRRTIQMVFQNPYASLNPGMNIREHLVEAVRLSGIRDKAAVDRKIHLLLEQVQLSPTILRQYPNQISGGEGRRIGLARVLALNPEIIVLDEPVASLDLSIKGELIALLLKLQEKRQLTYLWISHDIQVIHRVADVIVVMFSGEVVEIIPAGERSTDVYQHPYTEILFQTAQKLQSGQTEVTFNSEMYQRLFTAAIADENEKQCVYYPYCTRYFRAGKPQICQMARPELKQVGPRHFVRCHFPWKEKVKVPDYA